VAAARGWALGCPAIGEIVRAVLPRVRAATAAEASG